MNVLKQTSKVIERFKIVYPQYWQDMLTNEIMKVNGSEGQLITGKVLAILRHQELEREVSIPAIGVFSDLQRLFGVGHFSKLIIPGINIVGNDGDQYYAQAAAGESVTDDFTAAGAGLRLGSSATAPTKTDTDVTVFLSGTDHVIDGTYPQTNDGDSDNTGAAVDTVTWTYSYTTAQGNANGIQEGAISDVRAGPSTAVLTHFLFAASFNKTSSDTMKVIANGNLLGV